MKKMKTVLGISSVNQYPRSWSRERAVPASGFSRKASSSDRTSGIR
jgi:hypothetical protein